MRKMLMVGIGLVLLALMGPAAWAQDTVTMDKVVVTASRHEEAVNKIPAHVKVITTEQIEQSTAQNVAEVLSTLAGAHVVDPSGNRRNYWVALRGSGESSRQNVLLLVDGRRVNLADLSGPDWNLVPLERIARIEVIRGGRGTVLYGDNANQGVINIITKEGSGLEGKVSAAYGSYDTYKGSAGISHALDRFAYDISASFLDSDGYRDNSDSTATDVGANLRFDPSDTLRLHLSAGYHYDDTRNPGAILDSQFVANTARTDTFTPDDFTENDDYYVKGGLEVDMLTNDMFKLEVSGRWRDVKLYGSSAAYWFEADTQYDMLTISPQLIFREDFGVIANRITIGVDYSMTSQDYDSQSEYFGSPSQIVATLEKENFAYYIFDDLRIGKNVNLTLGYRYDRATFDYEAPVPMAIDSRTLDEEGYNVGLNYAFGSNSHLYGSYSRTFRYPVLDEQFYYWNSSLDTTLLPQKSDDFEIGATAAVTDNLTLSLALFRSDTENEIFYDFGAGVNDNIDGTVTRQGAELGLVWQYKMLSLSGQYTRTDVNIDGGDFDGNEFPFVPEDKASATAGLKFDCGLSLGLEAIFTGKSILIGDWDNDFAKADDYTVVNAKVEYAWRGLTFFVDFNNIFDEEYASFRGLGYNSSFMVEPGEYPAPDFNVLVGLRARFGKR